MPAAGLSEPWLLAACCAPLYAEAVPTLGSWLLALHGLYGELCVGKDWALGRQHLNPGSPLHDRNLCDKVIRKYLQSQSHGIWMFPLTLS